MTNIPKRLNYVGDKNSVTSSPETYYLFVNEAKNEVSWGSYNLVLIGVDFVGNKVLIKVGNIKPFLFIRIPPGFTKQSFINYIRNKLFENINGYETEHVLLTPGKGYYEHPVDWIKCSFTKFTDRGDCIRILQTYIKAGLPAPEGVTIESAWDVDNRYYYNYVAMEYNFTLSNWIAISAKSITPGVGANNSNVPGEYNVNYKIIDKYYYCESPDHIKSHVFDINDIKFAKPKFITATWDIESFSHNSQIKTDDPGDYVTAISFVFKLNPGVPLVNVVIYMFAKCELKSQNGAPVISIYAENQQQMFEYFRDVLISMRPDIISGFNDGGYDWPFMIHKMQNLPGYIFESPGKLFPGSFLSHLARDMGAITPGKNWNPNSDWGCHILNEQKVKIDADTYMRVQMFAPPGMLCFDTCVCLRQLNPLDKRYSLNHFLEKYRLVAKHDMPYELMDRIFRVHICLKALVSANNYNNDALMKLIDSQIRATGDCKFMEIVISFANKLEGTVKSNSLKQIRKFGSKLYTFLRGDASGKSLADYMLSDARNDLTRAPDVLYYNLYDSEAVSLLIAKTNLIGDARERVDYCKNSMFEAFYRANGGKVRSAVYMYAFRENMVFSTITNEIIVKSNEGKKYPGADVMAPVKGVYCADALTKTQRAINRAMGQSNIEIPPERVDPRSDGFNKELLKFVMNPVAFRENFSGVANVDQILKENETNLFPDRGYSGFDASSMYPSVCICYNLCLDKCITTPEQLAQVSRDHPEWRFEEIKFNYNRKNESPAEIRCWFIQNYYDEAGVWCNAGLYARILKELFDKRKEVKKDLGKYAARAEFIGDVLLKKYKLPELNSMDLDTLITRIKEVLDSEITVKQRAYQEKPNGFRKDKLAGAESLAATLPGDIRKYISDEMASPEMRSTKTNFGNFSSYYEEIIYRVSYYTSKSNSIKVYMNTFYGEAGNSKSPSFMVQIAGAITHYGRKTIIHDVGDYVAKKGFICAYGDTDSRYIRCNDTVFYDLDNDYHSGKLSKIDYFTKMVEITMDRMDELREDVNKHLKQVTGGKSFLTMAYEEVLFPVAFCGKKNYFGVKHENEVNFEVCATPRDADIGSYMAMALKKFMFRGIEIKKRGASEMAKDIMFRVYRDMFHINNTSTVMQIVYKYMEETWKKDFKLRDYAKSIKYNPKMRKVYDKQTMKDKDVLGGNPVANILVERMTTFAKTNPDIKIYIPVPGERIDVIICERNIKIDERNAKRKEYKVGDRAEIYENLINPEYKEAMKKKSELLNVDTDYYINGDIISQLAKLILFYPEYEKYYTPGSNDDPEEYKECNKKARNSAKKYLENYFKIYISKTAEADLFVKNRLRGLRKQANEIKKNVLTELQSAFESGGNFEISCLRAILSIVKSQRAKGVSTSEVIQAITYQIENYVEKHYAKINATEIVPAGEKSEHFLLRCNKSYYLQNTIKITKRLCNADYVAAIGNIRSQISKYIELCIKILDNIGDNMISDEKLNTTPGDADLIKTVAYNIGKARVSLACIKTLDHLVNSIRETFIPTITIDQKYDVIENSVVNYGVNHKYEMQF